MIKHAWRTLLRHRNYSLINLAGLSVSIAACLLLYQMVSYERSFDRHHSRFDRIVRVVTSEIGSEKSNYSAGIPVPAMDAMQRQVPQFGQFARLHAIYPQISSPDAPGRKFATDGIHEVGAYIEPAFFKIFDWSWLSGTPETALREPNSMVLTQKLATKLFGNWQAALDKTVLIDQTLQFAVRGIIADPPPNSDFQFNLLASYETLKQDPRLYGFTPSWDNISSNDQAWALLHRPEQFEAANKILAGIGQEEYKTDVFQKKHSLQRLADQHFNDQIGHLGTHTVSRSRLQTLGLIGVLILLMACFNFINLATAQAGTRAREVGVRKTLGSSRGQLALRFLGETSLMVMLAVILGAILAGVAMPLLKNVSEVPDSLPFFSNPEVYIFLVTLILVISLLAGLYPAVIMSGFKPAQAMKTSMQTPVFRGISLRKVLVLLQFGIAQALIIGTLVTVSQMDYIRNQDLGYQPGLVYTILGMNTDSVSLSRLEAFRNRLRQIPAVESVSFASDVPTSGNTWDSNFSFGRKAEDAPFNTALKIADAHYLETYGFRLLAGKSYLETDTSRSVVVSMLLLKRLGITDPEAAIGQELQLGRSGWRPIVGVVDEFATYSARRPSDPITILAGKRFYGTAGIRIRPENMQATTASIRKVFDEVYPEQVFEGRFLDERIAEFYRSETQFSALCKAFAALAIFISCLGLFGLASLMAAQKTKEIGIRKVLGASVAGVVGLLSKDFVRLVLLAFVLAAPLAWWAMNRWLEDFAVRTAIHWWIFGLTLLMVLLVAVLTVGVQALRAASVNPVHSLRNE